MILHLNLLHLCLESCPPNFSCGQAAASCSKCPKPPQITLWPLCPNSSTLPSQQLVYFHVCFLNVSLPNIFIYILAAPCGTWDSWFPTRDQTYPPAMECRVVTTGPPAKFSRMLFFSFYSHKKSPPVPQRPGLCFCFSGFCCRSSLSSRGEISPLWVCPEHTPPSICCQGCAESLAEKTVQLRQGGERAWLLAGAAPPAPLRRPEMTS